MADENFAFCLSYMLCLRITTVLCLFVFSLILIRFYSLFVLFVRVQYCGYGGVNRLADVSTGSHGMATIC